MKDGLNALINVARRLSSNPNNDNLAVGATRGQILRTEAGKLKMTPCWFSIEIHQVQDNENGDHNEVMLRPLLKDLNQCYFCPDTEFLDCLSEASHLFGGETVYYRRKPAPDFLLDESLDAQIKRLAAKTIPAIEQKVLENQGELVIQNEKLFSLGQPYNSFNRYDCHIHTYHGVPLWSEFDENIAAHVVSNATVIVPTLWLQEQGRHRLFLTFATDWRSSSRGDRVTGLINEFLITHQTDHGRLTIRTSFGTSRGPAAYAN